MHYTIAPVFKVADIDATIEWYQSNLGFKAYPHPDDPPYAFAILEKDNIEIMIIRVEGFTKKRAELLMWDAYIRLSCGEIKELYERLQSKVTIVRALEKTDHDDTEFEIVDCNGYVLCFGEALPE